MLADEMYKFREFLHERGIIFCYSGYLTEEVLTAIGGVVRRKLELDDTDRRIARGLFSLFVEQVQNVIRYSAEHLPPSIEKAELRYGVLTIGREGDRYFVSCGNLINQDDVERLGSSLDRIKTLDKQGLMTLYKETLKGETPEGSKGAGVGFVEIARRATNGFDFDFAAINDNHAYFCLKAYM